MNAAWPAQPDMATVDILIVGTGFAGLAMAIKLAAAGFSDVMLIEKAGDVGGTWRDNSYPGCACDIPSHLYSLSFAPRADWSRMYPQQPELFDYLGQVADDFAVRRKIRFNTTLTAASWDEDAGIWHAQTTTGPINARILVSATGGLHIPAYPAIPGLELFSGMKFHSATWAHHYDLRGKRVAVIGTGASAVQFVPQIAPQAEKLDVYQRTAAWIIPKPDRMFGAGERSLLRLPAYRAAFRKFLFWVHELRVLAFLGNRRAQKIGSVLAARHLARQVEDPVLREKLTPDYQMGCKRVMVSNDYYPALTRPNVELITDGIAAVRDHSIVDTQGRERDVDAIIFGTGFEVTTAYRHVRITGVGARNLAEIWDAQGMQAFLGIGVAGFPNYFMLLGPHVGLGHNSVVIMIEAQVRYIVKLLTQMRRRRICAVDVRPEVQASFIAALQKRFVGTVWQDGGCQSWYKDAHGRVTAIWPGSAASYRQTVRHIDLRDYHILTTQTQTTA
jgi:cation diffusion facilitator CzcD-associated flavoprotein CzcO